MFKKTVLFTFVFSTFQLMAGELVESAEQLRTLSAKILKLSERVEYGNASGAIERKLKSDVQELIHIGQGMKSMLGGIRGGPGGPGGPGSPYPPSPVLYSAKCHIDDDPSLDLNQSVVDVRSHSVAGLISDCQAMAQAMYPSQSHSEAVIDIIASSSPGIDLQSGECHIDDDTSFDFGQIVVGTIYGNSIIDIIKDCEMLAQFAYDTFSSSGLKRVNVDQQVPIGAVSGVCHIDDDTSMDFNQFIPGIVFGNSIEAISRDCKALAESTFGTFSSHGLKDIKY